MRRVDVGEVSGWLGKRLECEEDGCSVLPKPTGCFTTCPAPWNAYNQQRTLELRGHPKEMRHLLQRYLAVREAFVLDGDLHCSDPMAYSI